MSLPVSLKTGDIVQENADFIVNPSNTQLALGSGVSMAFRLHCGSDLGRLMQEARRGKPLCQGDVIVTKSLAPNFKYALHAAVMDYASQNPYPTEQTIHAILQNILKIVCEYIVVHESAKLAMPFIGCGVGGLKVADVARIYKDFFEATKIDGLGVVLVAYKQIDYEAASAIL